GAIDGELLVGDPREKTGTFSELQQRLNRKTVSRGMLRDYPAFMRCYDVLSLGGKDVRALPYTARRELLREFTGTLPAARFDLSENIPFTRWEELDQRRCDPPHPVIEGVMLKRKDSP